MFAQWQPMVYEQTEDDRENRQVNKTGDGFNKVWHGVEEEWKMMPGGY